MFQILLIILFGINNDTSKRVNCSFLTRDRILTGTTTLELSDLVSNGNEESLQIPQTLRFEHHDRMQFNVLLRTLYGFNRCCQTLVILFLRLLTVKWLKNSQ